MPGKQLSFGALGAAFQPVYELQAQLLHEYKPATNDTHKEGGTFDPDRKLVNRGSTLVTVVDAEEGKMVLTVDHVLTTTRSVRKRLDLTRPVPLDVIERCIEIAIQAPTGSNAQNWHFVVVTDSNKRKQIADLYRSAFEQYRAINVNPPQLREGDPRREQTLRIIDSATYLAEHLHEVPVHIIPCAEGRVENGPVVMQASLYGSILPATWSLMLALRSRGLGSAWTTLHLVYEKEVAKILGIPEHVTQAALLPVAYFKGEDFKPAKRLPVRQFISVNQWGNPLP